ncbi:hypothetical protein [Methylocystis sp.]|uniref:hypothetical protein n=1 Tax=Methylocystis sp. TaxID=1911079 RepID=UPI003D0D5BA3
MPRKRPTPEEPIVESHGAERADMLLSDASEEAIIAADKDAALAALRLERLEVAELSLIEQIDAARDSERRASRAKELERDAVVIAEQAANVDAACAVLAGAFAKLVAAIPSESGVMVDADHGTRLATPEDVARAILAQGLFSACPNIFEMMAPRTRTARPACVERVLAVSIVRDGVLSRFNPGLHGEECTITPAPIAANEIVVEPLREKARELRSSTPMAEATE